MRLQRCSGLSYSLCLDQISSYICEGLYAARHALREGKYANLAEICQQALHIDALSEPVRAELTLYLDESRDREMIAKMQDALANGHVVLKGSSLDDIDLSAIDLTQRHCCKWLRIGA